MHPRPVPLTLAVTCLAMAVLAVLAGGPAAAQGDDLVGAGRELYLTGCSSCHGVDGGGVVVDGDVRGPSLEGAGEAAAYYYLATGRMPLADPGDQPHRKEPAYSDEQIAALVAYVSTLGDGVALPDVDVDGADLAEGGVLYRAMCQACHSAFGSGGALSYGRAAPNLHRAEPLEVAAAVRIGPGEMPVFDEVSLSAEGLDDLVAYVEYLEDPVNEGGAQVGRNGPVPEGFVAWLFGVGGVLLIVAWIGGRDPRRSRGGRLEGGER
jgi:ubiquinol-cytochrome c reductase cytochrome c subunit